MQNLITYFSTLDHKLANQRSYAFSASRNVILPSLSASNDRKNILASEISCGVRQDTSSDWKILMCVT